MRMKSPVVPREWYISCINVSAALLFTSGCGADVDIGVQVEVHRAPDSVWSIAAADLTGDGAPEHILGTLDDQLIVQSADGAPLWTTKFGGLPFVIQCGDLDGDGRRDVVVSVFDAEGTLRAYRHDGSLLWT